MTQTEARTALLAALQTMPDEALSWLILRCPPRALMGSIWPDGLGGFNPDSQKAIRDVQQAAQAWLGGGQ